jgi:hypothetical protein
MRITKTIPNHDCINHIELRSDIESGVMVGEQLIDEGKILSQPECWAISATDDTMYQYDYKIEYEEDKKILSDYFVSPDGEKVFVLVEKTEAETYNSVDGWFQKGNDTK